MKSPFIPLAAFALGVLLFWGVHFLFNSARIWYSQYKIKKARFRIKDQISFNPEHPEVLKYKALLIDELGMDELLVETELDRIKTITALKKINKEIEKTLNKKPKKDALLRFNWIFILVI